MRFALLFFVLTTCFVSAAHAGPRPYYTEHEDSELQLCFRELSEHLTENTSYSAEDVYRDYAFGADLRYLYGLLRDGHKANDRQFISMMEKIVTEQMIRTIKNLREGFEFRLHETQYQVRQICSYAILEDYS